MASVSALQTLNDLTARNSAEAAARLGQANAAHADALNKLQFLVEYRHSDAQRLQQDMSMGLSMSNYHNYQHFLSSLDKAVVQQQQAVDRQLRQVQQQQREWQHCEQKRLAFTTLINRAEHRRFQQEQKREQKLNDEFAGRLKERKI